MKPNKFFYDGVRFISRDNYNKCGSYKSCNKTLFCGDNNKVTLYSFILYTTIRSFQLINEK